MKTLRRLFALVLALCMVLTLAACGNKDETGTDESSSSQEEMTNNEEANMPEVVTQIDKPEVGISMELSGVFSDCELRELSAEKTVEMVAGAAHGYEIIKTVNGNTVRLSTIIIAENSLVTDPQVRGRFPYIYGGNSYSILASIESVDPAVLGEEMALQIQSGIIDQLTTIFFDESVLTGEGAETPENTENTETENAEVVESENTEVTNTENTENTEVEDAGNTENAG